MDPRIVYEFGPFRMDPDKQVLLRGNQPIPVTPKAFETLLALVRRSHDVVTKEELLKEIWPDSFVEESNLSQNIFMLRKALGDTAENRQYIVTLPGRGYRFAVSVRTVTEQGEVLVAHSRARTEIVIQEKVAQPEQVLKTLPIPQGQRSQAPKALIEALPVIPATRLARIWWWLVGGAACLLSFAVGHLFRESPTAASPWKLRQLTADSGFSDSPALSRNGKVLAYSSDSGPGGGRDLYVKQVSGGQPIQLTSDGADNTTPDFSPDGSRIVFHSNREGGGIYEIPAFGGEVRLLAKGGVNPRYSPDGSEVAYWIGDEGIAVTAPGADEVWVVPVAGGEPRRIGGQFTNARHPIWSPQGNQLLLAGYTASKNTDTSALDWWVVSTTNGQAFRTGIGSALVHAGLEYHLSGNPASIPIPNCWLPDQTVIFSTLNGDVSNPWETGISFQSGMVTSDFRRLTAGSSNETEASCHSGNELAFVNVGEAQDVWSVPFDLNGGKPMGALTRTTQSHGRIRGPTVSENGRLVAFASTQAGPMNIWIRDLETGHETHLAPSVVPQRFPAISQSGTQVAYSAMVDGDRSVLLWEAGRAPVRLFDGLRATSWSKDEMSVIIARGNPYEVDRFDLSSRRNVPLVRHPTLSLYYARFSPDNRWVSFTERTRPDRGIIFIAPLDGAIPVPESAWIRIANVGSADWADWSPDGNIFYFTSPSDGHDCIWAQRLDHISHRPVGDPFAVQHFHGHAGYTSDGWSVGAGRIVVSLLDGTDNIWMMTRTAFK